MDTCHDCNGSNALEALDRSYAQKLIHFQSILKIRNLYFQNSTTIQILSYSTGMVLDTSARNCYFLFLVYERLQGNVYGNSRYFIFHHKTK